MDSIPEDARQLIKRLNLTKHPEGGYYKETYRSENRFTRGDSKAEFPKGRTFSTSIHFLLWGEHFSALHRIKSDEIWYFHLGASLTIHTIDEEGKLSQYILGSHLARGESFQVVVKAGCWFAVTLDDPSSYCLAGCNVAPGFDFRDFELADRHLLLNKYPQHKTLIEKLTQPGNQ